MTFGNRIVVSGVTAQPGSPVIDMDIVDDAVVGTPNVIACARAKKLSAATVNASFTDRMLQYTVTQGTTKTFNATDANFNNKPSVSVDGLGDPPYYISSIGVPASWTYVAVLRTAALKNGNNLLSIGTFSYLGTTYIQINGGADGRVDLAYQPDAAGVTIMPAGTLVANTDFVMGVSYNAATKTVTVFVGSPGNKGTYVATNPLPSLVSSFFWPIGYSFAGGFNFVGKWVMWAAFSQAFNAGDATFDAKIGDIVSASKTYWQFV